MTARAESIRQQKASVFLESTTRRFSAAVRAMARVATSLAMTLLVFISGVSATTGGQQGQVVVAELTCSDCDVALQPVVTLGDPDGPGMLESTYNWLHTDSRGRYYVTSLEKPYFWVFDSDGSILRRVGQRGQGPGEFRGISAFIVDADDNLYAFDPFERRLTVFSPDYELAQTVNLSFRANADAALVTNGIVVNAGVHTVEEIGYPVHLVSRDDGTIVRSFGSETGLYRPDMRDIIDGRAVGSAEGDAVWTGWWNQYVVERWDTDGQLTKSVRRDVAWFEPWWEPTFDINIPPKPVTQAVMQQGNVLWVLLLVADPDWRSVVKPRPDGRLFTIEDPNGYKDSIIEAIDLETGEVLASSRFEKQLNGFVEPGLVYGRDASPDGNITIPVWDLRVNHPGQDQTRRKGP